MEFRDYYKILGVDRNADSQQIKRAYRKLAKEFHPDRNPGNKQAEDRFKEINEAYEVLSDPEKRQRFDQLGESYTEWQQRGAPGGGFRWEDWVSSSGRQGGVEDLTDLFGGSFSDFFQQIFGGMGGMREPQPRRSYRSGPSRPQPYEQVVSISLHEAYHGTTRTFEVNGKRLEVKIPAGARTDLKVRMADALDSGGVRQDLILVINVAEDPRFERKGDDLYTNVSVDLYTAVLGSEVNVPSMTGNLVLKIPEGTQPDQLFRMSAKGMPRLKESGAFGDLYARIKVRLPRKLTEAQRQLFKKLAAD
jgi:curved DNA-binding protein